MKYGNRNIKNKEEKLNNRYDEENIRFRLDEFVAIYYTIYEIKFINLKLISQFT